MDAGALLSRDEMRQADAWTIEELGVPSLALMETAGRAVADAVAALPGPVVGLAGPGNNGADAIVAVRTLANHGRHVRVVWLGPTSRLTPDARHQLEIARRLEIETYEVEELRDWSRAIEWIREDGVVIDGLFGTGLSRPIEGLAARVIDDVERRRGRVVAVDIPSGIDADTGAELGVALPADVTVTFQFAKRGHVLHPGRRCTGDLRIADIGIPLRVLDRLRPKVRTVAPSLRARANAPRAPDTHKGRYGHVLVVAGSPERPGSALLSGRAALRTGAGLATVGNTEEVIRRLAPALVELMGLELGASAIDRRRLELAWTERDVLLIGPSLPGDGRLREVLHPVLQAVDRPAVLDAGALRALQLEDVARDAPTVLTPHPGEMAGLLECTASEVQADRIRSATIAADRSGAIIVLKGASTVVAHPDGRVRVVLSGNPGLATAGSGDVLGGVIAGLIAQGWDAFEAAQAGADLHGRAADRVAAERGERGLVAPDLLERLGEV